MDVKLNDSITRSVQYKTLKLFLVGKGERGKTTLLRRLKNQTHEKVARTTGIDIEDWFYPEATKGILKRTPKDTGAHFVVWDCAWQEVYQCFYSRRSLYLALFRLTDGPLGVDELDSWLRNIQFRAPGCPVIIVGTHLDTVAEHKAAELEKLAQSKYQDTRVYPKVVAVVSVSCDLSFSKTIERLRRLIYEISCHLQLSSDGTSLEYKKTMSEDDPKALFQEQVPVGFLELQKAIKKEVASRSVTGSPPVMFEEEYKKSFSSLCEEEGLDEATYYLHLQGTVLHFEDSSLSNVYFLDPQWLVKQIAAIISNIQVHVKQGVVEVAKLFEGLSISPDIQDKCAKLLEKFEVVLMIKHNYLAIPSMMRADCPSVVTMSESVSQSASHGYQFYQPPLRRFWLSAFVPQDYWHYLFCKIAMDPSIEEQMSGNDASGQCVGEGVEGLNWLFWSTGMAYALKRKILLVIKQERNEEASHGEEFRVEVHVNTPEWEALSRDLQWSDSRCILTIATQMLVMLSQHVVSLALDWFPGMLLGHPNPLAYVPCWKCYEAVDCTTTMEGVPPARDNIIYHNQTMVHCFDVDQCVAPAVSGRELMCVFHSRLEPVDMVPDLIFRDLPSTQEVFNAVLKITEDDVLGRSRASITCRGELNVNDRKQNVAVKIFMENIDQLLETKSIRDIMKMSREPEHLLYAYHQIRQEVSFLSNLNHPNLTELCGVKTQPMCLLLELAPKKSLRAILKEYKDTGQALEPLSLKMTAKQIAGALEYLHDRQIVHLDVKSPNVLVWSFPLATFSQRDRIDQAGNILLKLADYGISQVSTRMTIRVANNPVGTPGFIAPEMFGAVKEVSADKLDVFAFGMTIYELLSHKAPFENIEPVAKRNQLIKDGQRPSLIGKELRSPLLLQELMVQCWSQNPEDRPKMRDVGRWISTPEFERLRAQVYLKDVKTLSCACVCRITPEQVSRSNSTDNDQQSTTCDPIPSSSSDSAGTYLPNTQKPDEAECVQEVPFENSQQPSATPPSPSLILTQGRRTSSSSLYSSKTSGASQVWLCGRAQGKGWVGVYTYPDYPASVATFTGYLSKEDAFAMCPVKNSMWVGTTSGKLKVYHTLTLKCEFVGQLTSDKVSILDIVHAVEVSTVIVTTSQGDIWIFHDQLHPRGLLIKQQLCPGEELTIYHLAKVDVVHDRLEVWGSTGKGCLVVLQKTGNEWAMRELVCEPGNDKLKLLAFVVHCGFVGSNGKLQSHVWASYRSRSVMVSWDVQTKQQRGTFDCTMLFRNGFSEPVVQAKDTECSTNVLSLAAHGRNVFVGTSSGSIGMVDSETCTVLKVYGWHQGKVRTLLVMPREVEVCLCAEVPIVDQSDQTSADPRTGVVGTGTTLGDCQMADGNSVASTGNPLFVPNVEHDACIVTSIGNGRRQFVVGKSGIEQFGSELSGFREHCNDMFLLTWKS